MTPRVERAEVVVVGAGPAGSALAGELAARGRKVLLVDRRLFPRAKPCGECVSPGGVRALRRLGLSGAVEGTGPVPLDGWSLSTPSGARAWAAFPRSERGWGVDRGTFDAALLGEARRRGAKVLEGVHVRRVATGCASEIPRAWGVAAGGEEWCLTGSVLVGADGLRSVVAREIGALRRQPRLRKVSLTWRVRGTGPPDDRGHLLLGGEVTVGLAPVPSPGGERDRWNATLVVDAPRLGRELPQRGWDLLTRGLQLLTGAWASGPVACDGPWASGPFDWSTDRVRKDRVVLVGDAAGYYDPLTGQGIYRALRGAELAAGVIDGALVNRGSPPRWPVAAGGLEECGLSTFAETVGGAFTAGERVQRMIEGVLSRPTLREPALSFLGWSPRASSFLAGIVGDVPTRRPFA